MFLWFSFFPHSLVNVFPCENTRVSLVLLVSFPLCAAQFILQGLC